MIDHNSLIECCNLKSSPLDVNSDISLLRSQAIAENLSEKFKFRERGFNRQYAFVYSSRLKAFLDTIKQNCIKKWEKKYRIVELSELADLKNEKCIVIGTIFKRQDLLPSILNELSSENQLLPQPKLTNYVSPSDKLILEDGFQRIPLIGKINPNEFVNGVAIGVLGAESDNGYFEVEDYVFGNKASSQRSNISLTEDRYILMVSGLDIGGNINMLSLQMLVDWVNGELGCPSDQHSQSKICRVLIAGNSVKKSQKTTDGDNCDEDDKVDGLETVKELDSLLLSLVQSIDVDIMPGEFDPTNHTLPQQPIHKCIFPKSSNHETLHRVPNPYEFILDGRRILGTSGQPVNDIKSLTSFPDNITILESTLRWSHLAPTAPDTIACYPYSNEDPFIITEQPDIYFAGNTSSFETKLIHLNGYPVRIVCLPVFSETQTCALINLKTLECSPLKFQVFDEES